MRIGVLGTGMVGQAIGSRLIDLGHEVSMGSRTKENDRARQWVSENGTRASHDTFAKAAEFGHLIVNCTSGNASLDALTMAGEENLNGKILLDLSNPLDFTRGMPPTLTICNTDSLGEQIQRTFPKAKVVKSLNTVNCQLMVDPSKLPGEHGIFVCGNDANAKAKIVDLLQEFGWPNERVQDLGDITGARGTEMYLALWTRLFVGLGTANFNIEVVR